MGASEQATEGVSAARKVHGILCAAAVLGLALVAGCSSLGDTFNVTPFLREQITGDTWRACLARAYQVQTRAVLHEGRDWGEASRFSAKGWAALHGEAVTPFAPADLDVGPEHRARLEAARGELDAALSKKDLAPCECAKAQAAYDGWVAASTRPGANETTAQDTYASAVTACRHATPMRVEAH
jgi:hypothetical protein